MASDQDDVAAATMAQAAFHSGMQMAVHIASALCEALPQVAASEGRCDAALIRMREALAEGSAALDLLSPECVERACRIGDRAAVWAIHEATSTLCDGLARAEAARLSLVALGISWPIETDRACREAAADLAGTLALLNATTAIH